MSSTRGWNIGLFVGVLLFVLAPGAGVAAAAEICGIIPATLVITEDSELVCDVQCTQMTGPCIQFGGSHIKLRLNGFKMTGPAAPPLGCVPRTPFPPEDGVSSIGFDRNEILGPGLIQNFRRHGIFLSAGERLRVRHVTSHQNCFSGLQMAGVSDSDIEENVSVRNASASGPFPCGGNCISNSHGNRIRRNEFSGNGSIEAGPPAGRPNDFGVGLIGNSSGNVIEENAVGGNVNGLLLFPATAGNLIRRNVIAGNPPIQISATFGTPVGVDIRDHSAPGANTFEENLCITYEGATVPQPCPTLPKFAGHHNTSQGSSRQP